MKVILQSNRLPSDLLPVTFFQKPFLIIGNLPTLTG